LRQDCDEHCKKNSGFEAHNRLREVQEIDQCQCGGHTAIHGFGLAGMLRCDDEIRCGGLTTSTSEHAIDFLFVGSQSTTDLSPLTGNSVRSNGCETASCAAFLIAPGKARSTAI
jgi:hypothetical protein